MVLLSAETWMHVALLVGESASAAYLAYGAWLVLRQQMKSPAEPRPARRHLAWGGSA